MLESVFVVVVARAEIFVCNYFSMFVKNINAEYGSELFLSTYSPSKIYISSHIHPS